jgi:hypothetical protein
MTLALAIGECQVGTVRLGPHLREHTHSRPSRALNPTTNRATPNPEESLRNGKDNCV